MEAAFELARKQGMEAVQVKAVAAALGCSVQPVYGYCGSMKGLKELVTERTGRELRDYVEARLDSADRFGSLGRAYAAFAKEEPHLYRLWFCGPDRRRLRWAPYSRRKGIPVPGFWRSSWVFPGKGNSALFSDDDLQHGPFVYADGAGGNTDAAEVQRLQNSALAAFCTAAQQEERE